MTDFHTTLAKTIWKEGGVRCVMVPSGMGSAVELRTELRANPETEHFPILVVTASPQDNPNTHCPDTLLAKPCLLPTLLAASRLLLHRVLPAAARPAAPTA